MVEVGVSSLSVSNTRTGRSCYCITYMTEVGDSQLSTMKVIQGQDGPVIVLLTDREETPTSFLSVSNTRTGRSCYCITYRQKGDSNLHHESIQGQDGLLFITYRQRGDSNLCHESNTRTGRSCYCITFTDRKETPTSVMKVIQGQDGPVLFITYMTEVGDSNLCHESNTRTDGLFYSMYSQVGIFLL